MLRSASSSCDACVPRCTSTRRWRGPSIPRIMQMTERTNQTSGWRSIESAPKDGTEIIVGGEIATVWIVRNARWVQADEWLEEPEDKDGWWAYRNSITQEMLEDIYEP